MEELARRRRNVEMAKSLHPVMARRVRDIIDDLERQKLRPRIQCAWRSPADQLAAWSSGHSKLKYGFHNVTSKAGLPEALAVDLLDDDAPLIPSKRYLLQLAAAAQLVSCRTGIAWGLPPALRDAVEVAVKSRDYDRDVKVGWDPTHVEPADITVQQARAGMRPA